MSKNNKPNQLNTDSQPAVTEKVETAVEATPEVKTAVKEPVEPVKAAAKVEKVEPKESKPNVEAKVSYEKPVAISVGDIVQLKKTVTETVTGTAIPEFAYKNTYKVDKILSDRVVLVLTGIGTFKLAVKLSDITK